MPVYKDECVFCFDNPESEHGLDVCLECYIGTSCDPSHDFTARHFRSAKHSAFLNIKRRAVKRELKLETGDEEFETVFEFKTLGNDAESEYVDAIRTVQNADSYTAASQSNAWQLELEPCEHVALLESAVSQQPEYQYTAPAKCSDCELSTNLWVCLFCGHLGCGRKNYDGSGGNNHAIAHYESCANPGLHCLAVKTGTITPNSVDLYCYACDDEKKDFNIKNHLLRLGIDMDSSTKTEESMLELQLAQNARFAFGAGEAVENACGMKNLGNTCYLNSVVQSLFRIPSFAAQFAANDANASTEEAAGNSAKDLRTQLNKLKDGLLSQRYTEIKPEMFKWLVASGDEEFSSTRQQDAFEYFTRLNSLSEQMRNEDAFKNTFGFELERRVECLECHGVRYICEQTASLAVNYTGSNETEMDTNGQTESNTVETNEIGGKLSVSDPSSSNSADTPETGSEKLNEGLTKPNDLRNPPKSDNAHSSKEKPVLRNLIEQFCSPEQIEVKCPRCSNSKCLSETKFKSFPKSLAVCVGRFKLNGFDAVKVESELECPPNLSLEQFRSSSSSKKDEDIIESETNEEPGTCLDPAKVEILCAMGFDKELVEIGLKELKPNSNEEEVFTNLIELNDTLQNLLGMGFNKPQSLAALKVNSSIESAVEWLFAGNYEDGELGLTNATKKAKKAKTGSTESEKVGQESSQYALSSVVCHHGPSVHAGHYVAVSDGLVYNDETVSKLENVDEVEKTGYVYFFSVEE